MQGKWSGLTGKNFDFIGEKDGENRENNQENRKNSERNREEFQIYRETVDQYYAFFQL